MPELPEVEFVARELNRIVGGQKIATAELLRARLAPDCQIPDFGGLLDRAKINFVHRRGKNILFDLDNRRTLLTHLRMSGRFMLLNGQADDPKFTHAVLHFVDGSRLVFQDQRHFGLMKVIETASLDLDPSIAKLAPEPFSEDFGPEYLREQLAKSGRSLKEFLLDQTKVCGLGNIYASEAMFRAGISPKRKARNVPGVRIERLHRCIVDVLAEALAEVSGRTPNPVAIGEGVYGDGASGDWRVYEREGGPCRNCAAPIRRIKQGQRSTYYCPKCQR
ncbi:MAG: bifunctional DNA-formamidopyrimidine glycosylase/DNA-(apurinic or apyrimidinic site) lyase [Pyrinomonadaceae bacterium]